MKTTPTASYRPPLRPMPTAAPIPWQDSNSWSRLRSNGHLRGSNQSRAIRLLLTAKRSLWAESTPDAIVFERVLPAESVHLWKGFLLAYSRDGWSLYLPVSECNSIQLDPIQSNAMQWGGARRSSWIPFVSFKRRTRDECFPSFPKHPGSQIPCHNDSFCMAQFLFVIVLFPQLRE